MDRLRDFLSDIKSKNLAKGNLLGFFHVMIGRVICDAKGEIICKGLTWRELAGQLQRVRWDPDSVKDLAIDLGELPPRDRYRYWFTALSKVGLDTAKARSAGDQFAKKLASAGYKITP